MTFAAALTLFPGTASAVWLWPKPPRMMNLPETRRYHELLSELSPMKPVEMVHRSLVEQSCHFQSVVEGKCDIMDWCTAMSGMGATSQCSGNFGGEWFLSSTTDEFCFYLSEQRYGPYLSTVFDAATDFCAQSSGVIVWNGLVPLESELIYEITRPVQGRMKQTNRFSLCDESHSSSLFDGYCESCSVLDVHGTLCTSCVTCPDGALRGDSVDCSNVFPTMITTCSDVDEQNNDSNMYLAFSEYMGVVCSFEAVTNGRCTLEKFCTQLQQVDTIHNTTAVCKGDITKQWSIQFVGKEGCYASGGSANVQPYDASTFDPDRGYCSQSTFTLQFDGTNLLAEKNAYEITRPSLARGMVEETIRMIPCTGDVDYNFANVGFCAADCPSYRIGTKPCKEQCHECTNGGYSLDCSNIDPVLVDDCQDGGDGLNLALMNHFRKVNARIHTSGSTMALVSSLVMLFATAMMISM